MKPLPPSFKLVFPNSLQVYDGSSLIVSFSFRRSWNPLHNIQSYTSRSPPADRLLTFRAPVIRSSCSSCRIPSVPARPRNCRLAPGSFIPLLRSSSFLHDCRIISNGALATSRSGTAGTLSADGNQLLQGSTTTTTLFSCCPRQLEAWRLVQDWSFRVAVVSNTASSAHDYYFGF